MADLADTSLVPGKGRFTGDLPPISPKGRAIIAVDGAMLILAILWTAMRVWVRRQKEMSILFVEDIFCYFALVFFLGSAISHGLSVRYGGLGNHLNILTEDEVAYYAKQVLFAQIIYGVIIGSIKLSLLWMLRRIFTTPTFRLLSYITMAMSTGWALMPILVALLVCQPVAYNWNTSVSGGHCGNKSVAYALVSAFDLFTDSLIIALPIGMIFRLQMKTLHKIALAAIFGFGAITMVLTAVRLYYVYNIDFTDVTYSGIDSSIIASAQMGIAIMVSSSPLLRPVLDKTFAKWIEPLKSWSTRRGTGAVGESGVPKPDTGNELITFGRLANTKPGFQKMNDSEEHLQSALSSALSGRHRIYDGSTNVESAGTVASRDNTYDDGDGTLITKSTLVISAELEE